MSDDIKLRALSLNDIDEEYCSWYLNNDGHLAYFTGSKRVFSAELLIKDFEEGIKQKRWFYYLIINNLGEKIGNIKIGPIDINNKTSDLVCLIGNRNYIGKGLASKAILLGNQLAFNYYDIRRLQSGMYETNISSIKAYVRAGWFIESRMTGYYLMNNKPEDRVCVACLNPLYF